MLLRALTRYESSSAEKGAPTVDVQRPVRSVIWDLRRLPGGFLHAAIVVAAGGLAVLFGAPWLLVGVVVLAASAVALLVDVLLLLLLPQANERLFGRLNPEDAAYPLGVATSVAVAWLLLYL